MVDVRVDAKLCRGTRAARGGGMNKSLVPCASALALVAFAPRAHAADPAYVVGTFVTARQELIENIVAFKHKRQPVTAECVAAVDGARKAGTTTLTDRAFKPIGSPSGDSYAITLDRAAQVCSDYALYETISKQGEALDSAQGFLTELKPETGYSPAALKGFIEGKACNAAADALAKLPPSLPFHIHGNGHDIDVTVGDVKQKVCGHIADVARELQKAAAAKDNKNAERFTKYGIAGDRLELYKRDWGVLYLPGGASSDDIKKYATASVVFEVSTSDADGAGYVNMTVTRYQFSGNKLVASSSKDYRKPKGAAFGNLMH
jgi:hypothetical protein